MKNRFSNFISLMLSFFVLLAASSCKWETIQEFKDPILSFDKKSLSLTIGNIDYINLKVSENQNSTKVSWDYDENLISISADNYGAVVTALSAGSTTVTARCGANSATCLIKISEEHYSIKIENPYVYASTDFVNVKPGESYRLSAALFGGTSADINGFSWNIDKPNIASIATEGNYCWITGASQGIAKLTVRHTKSSFGYTILVNCSSDGTVCSYITSKDNIVTVNLSEYDAEPVIEVDLVNPGQPDYLGNFSYQLVDASGNVLSDAPVSITATDNRCIVSPKYKGNCYVKVKHPLAIYDYTILVRVLENPDLSYVQASSTNIILNDIEEHTVNFYVNGVKDFNFEKLEYNFDSNADNYIEYTIGGSNSLDCGILNLRGLKTGTSKLTVTYPGATPVNVLIIVREIAATAVSATTYITTTQNYVSMHIGDAPVGIGITLTDTYINAENELLWSCLSTAADGSADPVVSCIKATGTWESHSTARSTTLNYSASGSVILVPEKEGSATITVTHPNAKYPCRIVVTVLPAKEQTTVNENAEIIPYTTSLVTYLTTSDTCDGDGNVLSEARISSTLYLSVKELDSSKLVWSTPNSDLTVTPSGDKLSAIVTAKKDSKGRGIVTVSHPDCKYSITFNIIYVNEEAELQNVKVIYSDDIYHSIFTGNSVTLSLNTQNIEASDVINWSGSNNNIIQVEQLNKTQVKVYALKAGSATVTASTDFGNVIFHINVQSDVIINAAKDTFLSTDQNVIYLENGDSQTVSVNPVNINENYYCDTVWAIDNPIDYIFIANGTSATVQALTGEATATITVSHPASQNTLTIYVQTGNKITYEEKADFTFISTDYDVLEMTSGGEQKELLCYVNHTISNLQETSGFTFVVDDPSIAGVSNVPGTNVAYINPLKAGKTVLKISHPKAEYEKEVILTVNKSADFTVCPYITTNQNIITVTKGQFETATVSLVNCEDYNTSNWNWISEDARIADVVSNNGNTSLISGIATGTTRVKVSHKQCEYTFYLVIIVIDDNYAAANPYIQTNTNIIHLEKGSSAELTSKMVGGSPESDMYFIWNCSDTSIVFLNSASSSASVKGLNKGSTYITVKNSKYPDAYSKTILVIVEDSAVTGCSIKTSQSMVKIKPSATDSVTVNAELINGNPDDAKDFFWWADDYNIVNIDSVAGSCNITPTGVAGTTKIHVKHPKTSRINDIVVLVSAFDSFTFAEKTKTIITGQLYYVPLQVPATEKKGEVRYSSSNENVCVICGSNEVALISGSKIPGTASVKAELVVDSQVIATSEMLVSVQSYNADAPQIIVANTLLTESKGIPFTCSASLSGKDIGEDEKHKIYWTAYNVQNNNCCEIMKNSNGVASGYEVYVTPNAPGDCILTAHYGSVTKEIHVIVLDDKTVSIALDTSYLAMSIDDGSMKINAILENSSDYSSITWTAAKVGGKHIVTLTSQSKTCLVLPRNPGTTFITAQLPDGKKAQCMVYVEEAAKLEFEFTNVDVMPGYSVTVPYKVTPESSSISWLNTFANQNYSALGSTVTEYYSYDVDNVNHLVKITGLVDSTGNLSGTLKPYITSGQTTSYTPELNIYVGYNNLQFKCNTSTLYMEGATATATAKLPSKSFTVECFPEDTVLSYDHLDTEYFSVKTSETTFINPNDNLTYKRATVTITPKKEFLSQTIKVTGKLKNGLKVGEKTVTLQALYKAYDVSIDYIIGNSGRFTRKYNTGIEIGDGESFTFNFECKNPQAQITFNDVKFNPVSTTDQNASNIHNFDTANKNFSSNSSTSMITSTKTLELDLTGTGTKTAINYPEKECINVSKNSMPSGTSYQSYTFRHLFDYRVAGLRENPKFADLKECKGNTNNKWILVKKDMKLQYRGNNYSVMNHYNGNTRFTYTKWTDPNLNLVFEDTGNVPGKYNYSEWTESWGGNSASFEQESGQSMRFTAWGENHQGGCDAGYYKRLGIKVNSSLFPSASSIDIGLSTISNDTYYYVDTLSNYGTTYGTRLSNYSKVYTRPILDTYTTVHLDAPGNIDTWDGEAYYNREYSHTKNELYENYGLFIGDFLLDNDSNSVLVDKDNKKPISEINISDFKFLDHERTWNTKYSTINELHRTKPYGAAYAQKTYDTPNRGKPVKYINRECKEKSYTYHSADRAPSYYSYDIYDHTSESTVYCISDYQDLSQVYEPSSYLIKWDDLKSCPLVYQPEVKTRTERFNYENGINHPKEGNDFTIPEHFLYDETNLEIVNTVDSNLKLCEQVKIGDVVISYTQLNGTVNTNTQRSFPVYLTVRLCDSDVNTKWQKKTVNGIDGKAYERWYYIN